MFNLMLFIGCNNQYDFTTSPTLFPLQDLADEFDGQQYVLELKELKSQYSIGQIKTVKIWSEADMDKGEISYIPLMNGTNEIGIISSRDSEDIKETTDREYFKESASNTFDRLFSINIQSMLPDPPLNGVNGEFIGIDFAACVSETMKTLAKKDIESISKACDNWKNPNTEWEKHLLETEKDEAKTDLANLKKEEFVEEYRITQKENLVTYLDSLTVETYFQKRQVSSKNVTCSTLKIAELDSYEFNYFDSATTLCTTHIEAATIFAISTKK